METKYQRIKEIVEKELSCSAHDMEHVIRVYNLCLHLAKYEPGIDLDVLKTAALLLTSTALKNSKTKLAALTTQLLELKQPLKSLEHSVIPRRK